MQNDEFTRSLKKIMREYGRQYALLADRLSRKILAYMEQGQTITQAYRTAIKEVNFYNLNADAIEDAVYESCLKGYGIKAKPLFVAVEGEEKIRHKLMDVAWAQDKMKLSTRLHGLDNVLHNNVKMTVNNALRTHKTIKALAMELFDGYNSPDKVLNDAELPKYLKKIKRLTTRLYSGDAKAARESRIYKAVSRDIRKLKTPALRAAYQQALEASATDKKRALRKAKKMLETGKSQEAVNAMLTAERKAALDKALWVATQEKSRYYAERIARTESARAWYEGQLKNAKDDSNIFGFKWILSASHSHDDKDCDCDYNANADVGYGKGIYPKDDVPELPAHPNCMCHLKKVYTWEIEKDYVNDVRVIAKRFQ